MYHKWCRLYKKNKWSEIVVAYFSMLWNEYICYHPNNLYFQYKSYMNSGIVLLEFATNEVTNKEVNFFPFFFITCRQILRTIYLKCIFRSLPNHFQERKVKIKNTQICNTKARYCSHLHDECTEHRQLKG